MNTMFAKKTLIVCLMSFALQSFADDWIALSKDCYADNESMLILPSFFKENTRNGELSISLRLPCEDGAESEVWFCDDEMPSRASCNLVIGCDSHCVFVRHKEISTRVNLVTVTDSNNAEIELKVRFSADGGERITECIVNGAIDDAFSDRIANVRFSDIRSMKVVGRGIDDFMPQINCCRNVDGFSIVVR